MSMTYTYEIVSVDQIARCMEVVYTSEGNPTMHIGARLPYEGETVEAVVNLYAPVRYWEENKLAVVQIAAGLTGEITVATPQEPTDAELAAKAAAEAEATMYEQAAFEKKVAAALIKFGVLQADPTEIQVTQL